LEVASDQRSPLIHFVHGYDAYDGIPMDHQREEELDSGFLSPFKALSHSLSRPLLIYAGANDGMLHAFDDSSGEELWAFIPPTF
jgi:outer membrane protein assembly factor BamB